MVRAGGGLLPELLAASHMLEQCSHGAQAAEAAGNTRVDVVGSCALGACVVWWKKSPCVRRTGLSVGFRVGRGIGRVLRCAPRARAPNRPPRCGPPLRARSRRERIAAQTSRPGARAARTRRGVRREREAPSPGTRETRVARRPSGHRPSRPQRCRAPGLRRAEFRRAAEPWAARPWRLAQTPGFLASAAARRTCSGW